MAEPKQQQQQQQQVKPAISYKLIAFRDYFLIDGHWRCIEIRIDAGMVRRYVDGQLVEESKEGDTTRLMPQINIAVLNK